jgi:hypothetical protein
MIVSVHEDDIVESEALGEMDFGVCMKEININCKRCRIVDLSLYTVWLDDQ